MHKVKLTTETGSVYTLNFRKKTWSAVQKEDAPKSFAPLRTKNGTYITARYRIGSPLTLQCTSLSGFGGRLIVTSPVVSVEV